MCYVVRNVVRHELCTRCAPGIPSPRHAPSLSKYKNHPHTISGVFWYSPHSRGRSRLLLPLSLPACLPACLFHQLVSLTQHHHLGIMFWFPSLSPAISAPFSLPHPPPTQFSPPASASHFCGAAPLPELLATRAWRSFRFESRLLKAPRHCTKLSSSWAQNR